MALSLHHSSSTLQFIALLAFLSLLDLCTCFNLKHLNLSASSSGWSPAGATWYGSPTGAGSDGGACGYGNAVGKPPLSSMISAGNPSLFKSGKGCGSCYQLVPQPSDGSTPQEVKCTGNAACSRNPVTVVITDECLGGPGFAEPIHFDMSGTAFGSLAINGRADQLRNAGILQVQCRRVGCNYHHVHVAFRVDAGSGNFYFAVVIEYEGGDGDLAAVDLKPTTPSGTWLSMQQSWGAIWKVNSGSELHAPFSLRLTSLNSGKTIVANNVIPASWHPGKTYGSLVNFGN